MPYDAWKAKFQTEASPEAVARFKAGGDSHKH
jgi:hypothetical protein